MSGGTWKRAAFLLAGVPLVLVLGIAVWLWLALSGPTEPWEPPSGAAPARMAAGRQPCADHDPLRNAYFGDLHVHTAYSFDSSGRGVRNTPDDAYRFAKGEKITTDGGYDVQLNGPLDFLAVTDHGEYMGIMPAMATPGTALSQTAFRGSPIPP